MDSAAVRTPAEPLSLARFTGPVAKQKLISKERMTLEDVLLHWNAYKFDKTLSMFNEYSCRYTYKKPCEAGADGLPDVSPGRESLPAKYFYNALLHFTVRCNKNSNQVDSRFYNWTQIMKKIVPKVRSYYENNPPTKPDGKTIVESLLTRPNNELVADILKNEIPVEQICVMYHVGKALTNVEEAVLRLFAIRAPRTASSPPQDNNPAGHATAVMNVLRPLIANALLKHIAEAKQERDRLAKEASAPRRSATAAGSSDSTAKAADDAPEDILKEEESNVEDLPMLQEPPTWQEDDENVLEL